MKSNRVLTIPVGQLPAAAADAFKAKRPDIRFETVGSNYNPQPDLVLRSRPGGRAGKYFWKSARRGLACANRCAYTYVHMPK